MFSLCVCYSGITVDVFVVKLSVHCQNSCFKDSDSVMTFITFEDGQLISDSVKLVFLLSKCYVLSVS